MRWPLQPLQPLQQTQIQPLFGQSVDSLCHPWFTTTNLSYRFPILKRPPPPCAVLLVAMLNYQRVPQNHGFEYFSMLRWFGVSIFQMILGQAHVQSCAWLLVLAIADRFVAGPMFYVWWSYTRSCRFHQHGHSAQILQKCVVQCTSLYNCHESRPLPGVQICTLQRVWYAWRLIKHCFAQTHQNPQFIWRFMFVW